MHLLDHHLIFSPSDLLQFLDSPFASWTERRHLADPAAVTPDAPDPLSQVLSRRGSGHERAWLERLRAAGRNVCEIAHTEGPAATLAALPAEVDVIYQAPLAGRGFAGFADFLYREDDAAGGWSVWDTKLAREPKPGFIVQICCYADMLEAMTGVRPQRIGVVLGTGEERAFRTADFFHYYERVRAAFLALMARFPAGAVPEPAPHAGHGRWAGEAERWLLARDDLSQVANITRGQVLKLRAAGIATLAALAAREPGRVRGISAEVVMRLHRQARLQLESRGLARPRHVLLPVPADAPAQGLAALPPASPGDVYFDMEGSPGAGGDGLEYLFGAVTVEAGAPRFHDWWAHDARGERAAFEAFIDWVVERRRADPALHVHHYAAYETTALKRLMSKYASREEEIDALLRAGVFVDLYGVVRRGVMVGEPAYSLKNVEHLYRERRTGGVTDAGASVLVYERWCESGEPADWRVSPLLRAIRDYNEDDCVSTWQLAGWLRERQREAGIAWVQPARAPVKEAAPQAQAGMAHTARRELAARLLAAAPPPSATDPVAAERRRLLELLAWLVEFHRRADKPLWWEYFARCAMTAGELRDDPDCLADLRLAGPPEPVKQSLRFRYRFDPEQDCKLHEGSKVAFVPDIGIQTKIESLDPAGSLTIKIGLSTLGKRGLAALPEATALIPYDLVSPDPIPDAIAAVAERFLADGALPLALGDFLARRPPRLATPAGGSLRRAGESTLDAAIRLVRGLDAGCLCLQGPPGTGKTWTAARMIVALLGDGKSVGIASNGHKAILNLLGAVCEHGGAAVTATKVGGPDDEPVLARYPQIRFIKSARDAVGVARPGAVVGGTAWFFAQPEMAGQLDYLFVDEAGQVAVANLVGMAASARNLVLLGDQEQLAQPVQGVHPGESGQSVLEYFLQDHATVPPGLGLFLDTSQRMHPLVCSFISAAVYEDRLHAMPHTANRVLRRPADVVLVTRDAGLLFVPVPHVGNTQGSDEEVEAIGRIVAELARCEHTDRDGRNLGPLDLGRDVLVVAPYNLQVRKLAQALPAGMRIGTVDRFQGQEAPVVIVSMCTSPGESGGRGLKFVLDANRLNVAISRAQSLAIVVGDPGLAEVAAATVDDLRRLSLYARVQVAADL